MWPPASATASALSISCASLSTEQGPAITAKLALPIFTAPTETTVGSEWNSRLTSLKGLLTGTASTTPGIEMMASRRLMGLEPRTPMATRSSPGSLTGRKPCSSTAAQTASTSSAGACARIRISTLLGQHQADAPLPHLGSLCIDGSPEDRPGVEPILPLFDAAIVGDHAFGVVALDEDLVVDGIRAVVGIVERVGHDRDDNRVAAGNLGRDALLGGGHDFVVISVVGLGQLPSLIDAEVLLGTPVGHLPLLHGAEGGVDLRHREVGARIAREELVVHQQGVLLAGVLEGLPIVTRRLNAIGDRQDRGRRRRVCAGVVGRGDVPGGMSRGCGVGERLQAAQLPRRQGVGARGGVEPEGMPERTPLG